MGWRMDSSAGAHLWDTEALGAEDILCRDEELDWLKRDQRKSWKLINGRIARSGDPTMAEGTYGALVAYPPAQNLTAITGVSAITLLWSPATYTPLPANSVMAPEAYRIAATGVWSSGATAAPTTVWTPDISTTATTPGLGASSAMVYVISITNGFWYLIGDVTIRTAGTSGTAYGMFTLIYTTAAGPSPATSTATNPSHAIFGNTVVTRDFVTSSQGLSISVTPSNTTISHTPTQIHWMSWN
jgi:hypothetical protein